MQDFKFTLERMQRYKVQLLDREKDTLAGLRAHLADIDAQIQGLDDYLDLKNAELQHRQREGLPTADLDAYRFYIENTRLQRRQLCAERDSARAEVDRQTQVVLAAAREVNSLDKLEEKQHEEYRYEEGRENRLEIGEYVIGQFLRSKAQ